MSALLLDPVGGLAGDMILAALVDAGADEGVLRDALESLPVEGFELEIWEERRRGFRGRRLDVIVAEGHPHRTMPDVVKILTGGALTEGAVARAVLVFEKLATAEAHVHGSTIEKVHFHEVGAVDSIVDIAGIAVALDQLGIDRIAVNPIPLGTGTTTGAHGEFPLPAPATAALLDGWPVRFTGRAGEHTTPTGAAVVAALADADFRPSMRLGPVGVGFGARESSEGPVNMVRALRLTPESASSEIDVVEATIDDMTPEAMGFLTERLREAGARDVFLTSVQMKKGRPGTTVTVITDPGDGSRFADVLFRDATTIGVRIRRELRLELERRVESLETEYGPIRFKVITEPDGAERAAPEYEDVRSAALASGASFRRVMEHAEAAWRRAARR